MTIKNKPIAFFCGLSGYPFGRDAASNRYAAIADLWWENGFDVVFVNRLAIFDVVPTFDRVAKYATFSISGNVRRSGFFVRQLDKLFSYIKQIIVLNDLIKGRPDRGNFYINVYTGDLFDLIYYSILSRIFGIHSIFHLVEVRSSFANVGLYDRIRFIISDYLIPLLYSEFIVIGELTKRLASKNPKGHVLVMPPVCDFCAIQSIDSCGEVSLVGGVTYCASIAYEDVIFFVIESFHRALPDIDKSVKLNLVVTGALTDRLLVAISLLGDRCELFNNISYPDLIGLYKNSALLLLPLRDNLQDTARFPQKMCEYVASRRPVLTMSFGEVGRLFWDRQSAYVVDEYSVDAYSRKMIYALSMSGSAEEAQLVDAAYSVGLMNFDIQANVSKLRTFLALER